MDAGGAWRFLSRDIAGADEGATPSSPRHNGRSTRDVRAPAYLGENDMRSRTNRLRTLTVTAALLCLGLAGIPAAAQEPEFTSEFRVQDCRFRSWGKNPFFILKPGFQLQLEGESDGEEIAVTKTVTWDTQLITFEIDGAPVRVRTRVLVERETVDGELSEISHNFYAICRPTNDVYYFGEDVDIYEDGEIVSHDGAWRVGQDAAQPGIVMPGTFLLGARYHQEVAPGIAEDRAEHVAMGLDVETPAGAFSDCVNIVDTNPLDDESEGDDKKFCPGVGLTVDEEIELVEFGFVGFDWFGHD